MMDAIVTCECGRARWFATDHYGGLLERCDCGARRPLRGRTANDIEREEAAFRSRVAETPRFHCVPCAWDGCDGMTSGRNTDMCPRHCEERRRVSNRERMRAHMRDRRGAA